MAYNGASLGLDHTSDGYLIYNDYVRECLEEQGVSPEEVEGIFGDNERLTTDLSTAVLKQAAEQQRYIENAKISARDRQRLSRARRKGETTYRAADGTFRSTGVLESADAE